MLSGELLSTTAAFVLYILYNVNHQTMPSNVRTLCRTSVVWIAAKCHLLGSWISATYFYKISWKLLNCAEYIITRKRVYLFPCLKILLRHSNMWTQCNHHEPSCGVRSSWEGRETTSVSPLSLSHMCTEGSKSQRAHWQGMMGGGRIRRQQRTVLLPHYSVYAVTWSSRSASNFRSMGDMRILLGLAYKYHTIKHRYIETSKTKLLSAAPVNKTVRVYCTYPYERHLKAINILAYCPTVVIKITM